jgi:putative transposase
MAKVLQLSRSTYYYEMKERPAEDPLTLIIIEIFNNSRQNYGTRKIKVELRQQGIIASRRRIGRIMKEQGLVSTYTVSQFKPQKTTCNDSEIQNTLNRQFDQEKELAAVVSDLTYVRVNKKWNYVCVFLDLYNREIIGYSAGLNKDASLVHQALASVKRDLRGIQLFHTDRGTEFNNNLINEAMNAFNITRSLSDAGCPYDNAVAEAAFKVVKTEFTKRYCFETLEDLNVELHDYIHWYNNIRIHGTLGYVSPVRYRLDQFKKGVNAFNSSPALEGLEAGVRG